MGYGNVGSRMVRNKVALDQNDRAERNQRMSEEDWERDKPIRDAKRVTAYDQVLARDAEATSYGDEYDYALSMKNKNDEIYQSKMMLAQAKAMKMAGANANINAPMADAAMIQYGVDGSDQSLGRVSQHTSGSDQPDGDGYYSVGPMNVKSIAPANMTTRQRADMDRIRANRQSRVEAGVYKEETMMDGVKRLVNTVSNEVFGTDIWLTDKKGKVYSPEHLKMITGQPERAAAGYNATTPQSSGETQPTSEQPSQIPSTQTQPSTQTEETEIQAEDLEPIDESAQAEGVGTTVPETDVQTTDTGIDPIEETADYDEQYDKMPAEWNDKINTTVASLQTTKPKEGTAAADALNMLTSSSYGPEMDTELMKAYEQFPEEMTTMSSEDFGEFYKEKVVREPSTVKEAAKTETTDGDPRMDLIEYRDKYIAEKEHNANAGKGRRQLADGKERNFMSVTNQQGAIDRAIKAGVESPEDLHNWVNKTGKFKPTTAKERRDTKKEKISDDIMDRIYPKNNETGKSEFSMEETANLDPKEAAIAQQRTSKNTDLKKDRETLVAAKEWYTAKDEITKLAKEARTQYSEPLKLIDAFKGKWFGGGEEDEKQMARMYSKLSSIKGTAVANRVKLLSGTAASDKERETIMRFMFGDPNTTLEDFEGAIAGSTTMMENTLKNNIQTTANKGGFSTAQQMAKVYTDRKGEGDITPKTNKSKSSKTSRTLSKTQQKILDRIKAGTWTRPTPSWAKGL